MTVEKSALLVVDMQNDFCVPGGPLFVPGAPAIFDAVREAVDVARSKGVHVVWVVREHHPSGERERLEGERGTVSLADVISMKK
jgi:nicotinamidase-related amidase